MAYKFNDDDKEVREFKESLPFGVHKVQFTGAIVDALDDGREYIAVGFVTEDGFEDEARVWFTGKAANISFNTLRQMAVHNGKDDKAKDANRDAMDAAGDTQELVDALNKIMEGGGEFWVRKEYDPSRTYQAQDGSTRRSINTNIFGYEPKVRPEFMPKPAGEEASPIEGATPASDEEKANIPKDWA